MSKKKLLIHEVFNKAREDFPNKNSKSGLSSELSDFFERNMNFFIHEKTFTRYYDAYIGNGKEMDIKDIEILDKLSQYLEYKGFVDFSRSFVKKEEQGKSTTLKIDLDDDELLSEKIGNNIKITINQQFKLPEFVKQNGLGIAGMLLVGSLFIGNYYYSSRNKTPLGFFGGINNKSCMYWDQNEYKPVDCEDKDPTRSLMPKDTVQLRYFKRITRKDTLTVENALGRTWYSKYNGNVEFFTMDGIDPDNGRELRSSTPYIIEKYAGPPVQAEE
nr:hypothetical protein [uncultured Chryseobacterium sp.]